MCGHLPSSTLFPYTTLFRSGITATADAVAELRDRVQAVTQALAAARTAERDARNAAREAAASADRLRTREREAWTAFEDRKSTRLNSSHVRISYAGFCLKKK